MHLSASRWLETRTATSMTCAICENACCCQQRCRLLCGLDATRRQSLSLHFVCLSAAGKRDDTVGGAGLQLPLSMCMHSLFILQELSACAACMLTCPTGLTSLAPLAKTTCTSSTVRGGISCSKHAACSLPYAADRRARQDAQLIVLQACQHTRLDHVYAIPWANSSCLLKGSTC